MGRRHPQKNLGMRKYHLSSEMDSTNPSGLTMAGYQQKPLNGKYQIQVWIVPQNEPLARAQFTPSGLVQYPFINIISYGKNGHFWLLSAHDTMRSIGRFAQKFCFKEASTKAKVSNEKLFRFGI